MLNADYCIVFYIVRWRMFWLVTHRISDLELMADHMAMLVKMRTTARITLLISIAV